MTFKFLDLPLLPLEEIMSMMDVSDLLKISSCNRTIRDVAKGRKQIKSFYFLPYAQKEMMDSVDVFELLQIHRHLDYAKFFRVNPISFNLIVSNEIGIEIRLKDDKLLKWNIFMEFIGNAENYRGTKPYFLKINGEIVPSVLTKKSEMYTFWNDRLEGVKTMIAWLRRSFNMYFETFHVEGGSHPEFSKELRSIVNFANYRQHLFTNVMIDERKQLISHADLNFVAENVTAFKKHSHLGRGDFKGPRSNRFVESKSLLITDSRWFTLDHLLMTHCSTIRLVDSALDMHELSIFTLKVLKGDYPKLKHFCVKTYHKNWVSCILFKTNMFYSKRGYIRDGVYRTANDQLIRIPIGIVIESLNREVLATLIFPMQSDHPKKLKTFEMLIWPDFDGSNFDRNEVHYHPLGRAN
ncbi:hypothetical protein CAEBREN_13372 [Caenorhabditis brenneri]|uniref:F-box domain-containing protein n=1 Tax=Caenorhabditis brenneri TaxID=135651 RepID=G0NSN9_CAEBE|nr:hypothetical protein CAEBREN_13372 [Caenorhabditis brenneri]